MTDTMPASWYAEYRRTVEPSTKPIKPILKPCPFCGGRSYLAIDGSRGESVVCLDCQTIGPCAGTGDEAAAWNAAPDNAREIAQLKARITEFEAALRPFTYPRPGFTIYEAREPIAVGGHVGPIRVAIAVLKSAT